MQIYGRGLRRRLPPMLDGDPRRLRMAYSLLFSLPGTPVLFYGEEIGMGEELAAEGRNAVRTPMQWTAGRNGGFSDARPSRLPAPVVAGGFGPEHVNVEAQLRDDDSLLAFIGRLIRRYREAPELGWGDARGARPARTIGAGPPGAPRRLMPPLPCTTCRPSRAPCRLQIPDVTRGHGAASSGSRTEPSQLDDRGRTELAVEGYGYHWFRVSPPGDRRLA